MEEIKKSIAKSTGLRDHHRVGLFDPETKKTFKDRAAKAGDVQAALGGGELLVKDLGMSRARTHGGRGKGLGALGRDLFLLTQCRHTHPQASRSPGAPSS